MQVASATQTDHSPRPLVSDGRAAWSPNASIGRAEPQTPVNDQFVAMLNAYRSSGGLARGGEVLALFGRRGSPDLAQLARRIVQRQVIAFDWQFETWLPWFQFNKLDLGTHAALEEVLVELNPVHDPWQLAGWFVRRHEALRNRTPAAVFATDPSAVKHAARSDRLAADERS